MPEKAEDAPRMRTAQGGARAAATAGRAWEVYCDGPLLKAVQSAELFPDSKTFVDMPMKQDPGDVLAAFELLSEADRGDPSKLRRFVAEYFDEAGSDIVPLSPPDFSPDPAFLESIKDDRRREWARSIHRLWALLVRRGVDDVALRPERHSLLPRRHPVVVPGGRFRESYYWDTFWTIRGLLVSGMVETARGVVLNLLDDVDRFGFVPNGGRLYYTERSQPPLLSDMVCELYSARPDHALLARALPSLESEHAFWMDFEKGRAVCVPALPPPAKTAAGMSQGASPEGAAVLLNRYWGVLDPPTTELDDSSGGKGVGGPLPFRRPRPESYREDARAAGGECVCDDNYSANASASAATASGGLLGGQAAEGGNHGPGGVGVYVGPDGVCHDLAAAAESGWDFSSRWAGLASRGERMASFEAFPGSVPSGRRRGRGDSGSSGSVNASGRDRDGVFCLSEMATTAVVPVDLNAFLHRAELNIARLHHALACCFPAGSSCASPSLSSSRPREGTVPESTQGCSSRPDAAAVAAAAVKAAGEGVEVGPPPLLGLNEMQRHFLARRRRHITSWSSSSSSLLGKFVRAGEGDSSMVDGDAASDGGGGGGCCTAEGSPLAWAGTTLCREALLFMSAARARADAMEQTMWDGGSSLWRDLLLPTGEQSSTVTPACFVPMWAGLPWPRLDCDIDGGGSGGRGGGGGEGERLARCVESLRSSGLVQEGGVRTSLEDSGQQWDGRNAWPPLQWLLIQGLRRSADAVVTAEEMSRLSQAEEAATGTEEGAPASGASPLERPIAAAAAAAAAMSTTTRSNRCPPPASSCLSPSTVPAGLSPSSSPSSSPPSSRAGSSQRGGPGLELRVGMEALALAQPASGMVAVEDARNLATQLEEAFLSGALAGWERTGAMMEKYNAEEAGEGGGGGEYNLQVGFGWTNGVALDLMAAQSAQSTDCIKS